MLDSGRIVCRVAAFAMRTRFEIVLWDDTRAVTHLRAAGEEALREVAAAETLLSAYDPAAEVFALNERLRGATGRFAVSPSLGVVLRDALHLGELTGHAFDSTLGDADATFIDAADPVVFTTRAGVRFDMGAVGKGYALDRAGVVLRDAGVRNALLHGGTSSVLALGHAPDDKPWRVAIESADAPAWPLADGDALGVSATRDRRHIVDGRTGERVSDPRLAAVRIAGSATVADAVSTALIAVGINGLAGMKAMFPSGRDWLVTE